MEGNEELVATAKYYAQLGYSVLPLTPNGKIPITSHGCLDATTNIAQIEDWWRRRPNANIGIATKGLLAIDVDDAQWLVDSSNRLSDLSAAPHSFTPRGGRHFIFRQPAGSSLRNTTGKIAPQVDTRANGGYIVVPPSKVNGKSYRWANGGLTTRHSELPLPPDWTIDALMDKHAPTVKQRASAYLAAMPPSIAGANGHNMAYSAAVVLVHGFGLGKEQASLLFKTEFNPRCSPLWTDREIDHKISQAMTKPHSRPYGWLRDDMPKSGVDISNIAGNAPDTANAAPTSTPDTIEAPLVVDCMTPKDLMNYRAINIDTLLGNRWLCRGGSCLLVGQTGLGKSSLAMQAAISWSLGESFFGIKPKKNLKSLFLQAENDTGDLSEMFRGIMAGMNYEYRLPEMENMLHFVSEAAICGKEFHNWAKHLIDAHSPDLVWMDPLFSFLGGNVSDQETVSKFLRNGLGAIAQKTGVCWMVVHHTNKPPADPKQRVPMTSGNYSYLGSGSAELANWARAVLILRETGDNEFELRTAKRGGRAGLIDAKGIKANEIAVRHSFTGICWERASNIDGEQRQEEERCALEVIAEMPESKLFSLVELRKLAEKVLNLKRGNFTIPGKRGYRILRYVTKATATPDRLNYFRKKTVKKTPAPISTLVVAGTPTPKKTFHHLALTAKHDLARATAYNPAPMLAATHVNLKDFATLDLTPARTLTLAPVLPLDHDEPPVAPLGEELSPASVP